ncbi:MAG: hypothetical protein ACPGFA_04330 [Pikeienuella sp.]
MSIMFTFRYSLIACFLGASLISPLAVLAQPAAEMGAETGAAPEQAPPPANETRAEKLDRLFAAMAGASVADQNKIALEIKGVWANSGSPSMNLLLDRALQATAGEAYDKARVHLNALTRLAPEFAEAWNASATLYFVQNDYGRAVAHIQNALVLEPRHFNALAGLAIILERVDRPGPALDAWMRVKTLYPDFVGAIEAIERLEPVVRGKEL